jgi:hypothetical protein
MSDDLDGYIRQRDAAKKYGVTEAAITLRRKRPTNKVRSKEVHGAVFVFEEDVRNFVPKTPGPKLGAKRKRKPSKVS